MKIRDVRVDGFGPWAGVPLPRLGGGLNVVYGGNGSGKSTLLELLRAVLFGDHDPRQQSYHDHHQRPGGSLLVISPGGPLRVTRHFPPLPTSDGPNGAAGKGEAADNLSSDRPYRRLGQLRLTDQAGQPIPREVFSELLGGIDGPTFRDVFALGLSDLNEIGLRRHDEAAQLLHDLSAGRDYTQTRQALDAVLAGRNSLYDPAGGNSLLSRLVEQRRETDRQLLRAADGVWQRERLLARQRQLSADIAELESLYEATDQEWRVLDGVLCVREAWEQLPVLEEELASLGAVRQVTDEDLVELDEFSRRLAARRRQSEEASRQRQLVERELASLGQPPASGLRDRLAGLLFRYDALQPTIAPAPQLAAEVAQLQAQRASIRRDMQRLAGADLPETLQAPAVWERLEQQADALTLAERRQEETAYERDLLSEELATETNQLAVAREQRKAASAVAAQPEVSPEQLANQQRHVAQLHEAWQLERRLRDLHARRTAVQEELGKRDQPREIPGWIQMGLRGLFLLGAGMTIAGLLFRSSGYGALFGAIGLIVALAALLLEMSWRYMPARPSSALTLAAVEAEIERITSLLQIAHDRLPAGEGSLAEQYEQAEADLAAWQAGDASPTERAAPPEPEPELDEGPIEALIAQLETASTRADAAAAEFSQAAWRWEQQLTELGLPARFPPAQAPRVIQLRRELHQIDERLRPLGGASEVQTSLLDAWRRDALAALLPLRRTVADESAAAVKFALGQAHDEIVAAEQRRRDLQKRSTRLRGKLVRAERWARYFTRCRRRLLERLAADDETQLAERLEDHARFGALRRRADDYRNLLDRILHAEQGEEVRAVLRAQVPWEQLEARHRRMEHRRECQRLHLERVRGERGKIAGRLDDAGRNTPATKLRRRREHLDQQIDDAVWRWFGASVCVLLVSARLRRLEDARQPMTLRLAGNLLGRLTKGRYQRVLRPLETASLQVEDRRGRTLPVERLSQGTREQLYLALRLALVGWYGQQGIRLPIVLDDVLANFDAHRAAAALRLFRELAERGQQILLLTCQPELVAAAAGPDVRLIALPGEDMPDLPATRRRVVRRRGAQRQDRAHRSAAPRQARDTKPARPTPALAPPRADRSSAGNAGTAKRLVERQSPAAPVEGNGSPLHAGPLPPKVESPLGTTPALAAKSSPANGQPGSRRRRAASILLPPPTPPRLHQPLPPLAPKPHSPGEEESALFANLVFPLAPSPPARAAETGDAPLDWRALLHDGVARMPMLLPVDHGGFNILRIDPQHIAARPPELTISEQSAPIEEEDEWEELDEPLLLPGKFARRSEGPGTEERVSLETSAGGTKPSQRDSYGEGAWEED